MARLTVLLLMAMLALPAQGAAWTLAKRAKQWQNDVVLCAADSDFNGARLDFEKLFVKSTSEYGLDDSVTLISAQSYSIARWNSGGQLVQARSYAFDGGVRIRLLKEAGVFSLQAMLGGGRDIGGLSQAKARRAELRLLYGHDFKMLGMDGFAGLEAAGGWTDGWQPRMFALDAVAGLWLSPRVMAMVQSFNSMREDEAAYRLAKLQISLAARIVPGWAVRLGAFHAPAGLRAGRENGLNLSLWVDW